MTTAHADTAAPAPAAEAKPSHEMTAEQSASFWKTGELPTLPKTQDSAPAKEKPAVADSAPQKDAAQPDSAPDKSQPHRKTKEDTERRIQELLDRAKRAEERADAAERRASEKRDDKQTSQPAPKADEPQAPPPLKQFMEKFFAEVANKGKSYEEAVEAWQDARDKFRDAQHEKKTAEALARDRAERAQEAAKATLAQKLTDAEQRYGKEEVASVFPALEKIMQDQQIPNVMKAMLDRSDVVIDLIYALGKKNVDTWIALSKTDPAAALEALVELQSDVRKALKAPKTEPAKDSADKGADKGADKSATPRTPIKAPAEVSARAAATEDPGKVAAREGNFKDFDLEQRRRYRAANG